jgi:putative nucleotidyltransferase with HDIG domain
MRSQAYIPTVSAAGLLVIGHCIGSLVQNPVGSQWLALAVLTLFTGALTIKVPTVPARLSVSETFVFASVLLFGTCAGTITVALEILIAVAVVGTKRKTDPQRLLFNVSSAALSIWTASHAFYLIADVPPLATQATELHTLVFPLAVLCSTYFILNSGLIAIAVSLNSPQSPLVIWKTNFLGLAVNYFAGASLAWLFVSYTRTIDLFAISVIVPLLLVSYLTFKMSLGRIEDATKHVEEVKRLYFSTIETLATAIDAKDQVTHGHIRRVQQFALALAHEVGLTDPKQLEALEAAALLHDTGKLAIPEHILNKPGKLSAGEFETMKTHARVGADILSSIAFPFPVVPIVRHHHENWDGTGYPDGLKSTDIPIGARILAVVDCFDALTSDRPYRRRMSVDDALQILFQRRGVMYDPLVVDTFASCLPKLLALDGGLLEPEHPKPSKALDQPARPVRETVPTEDNVLGQDAWLEQALEAATTRTGAELALLFANDTENDCIVSVAARGVDLSQSASIRMQLGHGVSGWVAVNGKPVVNADPALELRDLPSNFSLVRTICVPIRRNGEIAGVLSLYSTDPRGFSDEDRAYLENFVAQLESERASLLAQPDKKGENPPPRFPAPTIH